MLRKPKIALITSLVILAINAAPAMARVDLSVDIGVPPPAPQVEVVPAARPGFVWAPGYWSWDGGHHVWVAGHWMTERPGFVWVADRWEVRGERHHFEPGHWEHR